MDKKDLFKREDLEAELFEAKLLVELMQVARATIVPDMKQKMETTLLDNLRLQEKVMLRDRVIAGHGLFPIYHYDQRVLALRQAVAYWHHQAENKCEIIKNECIRMRK